MKRVAGKFAGDGTQKLRLVLLRLIQQQPFTSEELIRMVKIETGVRYNDAFLTRRLRELRAKKYGDYTVNMTRIYTSSGRFRFEYSSPRPEKKPRTWASVRNL